MPDCDELFDKIFSQEVITSVIKEKQKAREEVFEFGVDVEKRIIECQKKDHVQQVAFSTYHHTLTQVCFTCGKVRTGMEKLNHSQARDAPVSKSGSGKGGNENE